MHIDLDPKMDHQGTVSTNYASVMAHNS